MNFRRLFIIVCCVLTLGSGAPSQADILDFMPAIIAGATAQTAAMSKYFILNTDIYEYGDSDIARIVSEPATLPGITGLTKQTLTSNTCIDSARYYKWQGPNLYMYGIQPISADRIDVFDSPVNLGSTIKAGMSTSETRNTTIYDSQGTQLCTGTMTLTITAEGPQQIVTDVGTFSSYRLHMTYLWSNPIPGGNDVYNEAIFYLAKDAGIIQYTYEDAFFRFDYPLARTVMDMHIHDQFTLNTPSKTFTEASSGDIMTVTYQDVVTSQGTFKEINMSVDGAFTLGDMLAYDADENLFFYGRRNAEKLVVYAPPKCILSDVVLNTPYNSFTSGLVYNGTTGSGTMSDEITLSGEVALGSIEYIAGIQCYSIVNIDSDTTFLRKETSQKNFYDRHSDRITYWFNHDEGLVQIKTYDTSNETAHVYLRSDLVGL